MDGDLKYASLIVTNLWYICDMMKGNELDVGNIDFELQERWQMLMLYIV